jgi:DNA-dependent metalloprotease WSS1
MFEQMTILKTFENSSNALSLLKRAADNVLPIMKNRKWKVKHLQEFYPSNPNLLGLNVNHGLVVKVRLRKHSNKSAFLEYIDVLGTLLHELVHIVHSAHDQKFYKLLDELWDEIDESLVSGGHFGFTVFRPSSPKANSDFNPFGGRGRKLGSSRATGKTPLREKALRAAETRASGSSSSSSSGSRKLGGVVDVTGSAREMAVRAALKRQREFDDGWCASNSVAKAEDKIQSEQDDIEILWECKSCTLHNKWELKKCAICETPKETLVIDLTHD